MRTYLPSSSPSNAETLTSVESRSQFAEEQIKVTTERLATYEEIIATETTTLARLEQDRDEAQQEITEFEETIQTYQAELQALNAELEEKTKKVEEVKKTTGRASKVLDQAIKEIATHVSAVLQTWRKRRAEITCRTMRSRSSGSNVPRSIGSVDWTRSNCRSWLAISRTCLWKRYVLILWVYAFRTKSSILRTFATKSRWMSTKTMRVHSVSSEYRITASRWISNY